MDPIDVYPVKCLNMKMEVFVPNCPEAFVFQSMV